MGGAEGRGIRFPPTTNHPPPTTNDHPPATSHQPPTTNHQPPTTNHQPPTTNHQPPTTNHQPPTTNNQPPVTNHQSPVTSHQPPAPTSLYHGLPESAAESHSRWRPHADMLIRFLVPFLIAAPLLAQDTTHAPLPQLPGETSPRVTAGVTTGTMDFADQRVQQGVTGVLRYRIINGLSISASPTFARVAFPSTLGGGAVSGLTDLPVELSGDHAFAAPWSPTPGFSLGASLPIGDQAAGFGTGGVGASAGVGLSVSPLDG